MSKYIALATCVDVYDAGFIKELGICCPSCHEDEEMGYDQLEYWKDMGDNDYLAICCGIINYLRDNKRMEEVFAEFRRRRKERNE